jgi:hypothetical protein
MGVTQIKAWFNRFKDGHVPADRDQHSRRPSMSQNGDVIAIVWTLIMEDHRLTVREIADEGFGHAKTKSGCKICGQAAQLHLEVTQDMLECTNRDPEFQKTDHWSWVYGYGPETKVQPS